MPHIHLCIHVDMWTILIKFHKWFDMHSRTVYNDTNCPIFRAVFLDPVYTWRGLPWQHHMLAWALSVTTSPPPCVLCLQVKLKRLCIMYIYTYVSSIRLFTENIIILWGIEDCLYVKYILYIQLCSFSIRTPLNWGHIYKQNILVRKTCLCTLIIKPCHSGHFNLPQFVTGLE